MLDEAARLGNRYRFREEFSHGVWALMQNNKVSRREMCRRLGWTRGRLDRVLEGTAAPLEDTLDAYLALGAWPHITLGTVDQMVMPTI